MSPNCCVGSLETNCDCVAGDGNVIASIVMIELTAEGVMLGFLLPAAWSGSRDRESGVSLMVFSWWDLGTGRGGSV